MAKATINDQLSRLDRLKALDMKAFETPSDFGEWVIALTEYWEREHREHYMDGVDGGPDWKHYEHDVWAFGEAIRPYLQKQKTWRGKNAALDAAATVASDRRFGKGRQTFVLLLGDFGEKDYGPQLGALVSDSEVVGHAIKALTKAKVSGYRSEVTEAQGLNTGWIKNAAQKYLTKSLTW